MPRSWSRQQFPETPTTVPADAFQIRLVLRQPASQCDRIVGPEQEQATPDSHKRAATGKEIVEVTIGDTGGGLSLAMVRNLFEPYQTTKPDGMGLGLAIVPGHRPGTWRPTVGEIASSSGNYLLLLPYRFIHHYEHNFKPTVYLVDDDKAIRDSLRVLLKSAGIPLASFGSAEEFLEEVPENALGCVLAGRAAAEHGRAGTDAGAGKTQHRPAVPAVDRTCRRTPGHSGHSQRRL